VQAPLHGLLGNSYHRRRLGMRQAATSCRSVCRFSQALSWASETAVCTWYSRALPVPLVL
jgi:hypothetical protein